MTNTKTIQIGQRVHCILYGGKNGSVYAIHGEQHPETVRTMLGFIHSGGNAQFDIVWDNGTESLAISESIIRGVQWRILDEVATEGEIQQARAFAVMENTRRAEEKQAAQEQRARDIQELKTDPEYRHLTVLADKYDSNGAAKNVRADLKRQFPGVKFGVRKDHNSLSVTTPKNWTDEQVQEAYDFLRRFRGGSFDGSTDSYVYSKSPWNEVFGSFQYISVQRDWR